ncbi:YceD family protein [Deferrisoma camini]|uniref:YceD family protein n=1 Tax=Deferrisoma camini TaxID=1035120 RepID=UPI00046CD884|nr:DUF177 domain-containing protein [Deferrisoma camini]
MVPKFVIAVDRIPSEGWSVHIDLRSEQAGAIARERGWTRVEWVSGPEGSARVLRSGRDVFVTGEVRAVVRCTCVRCLERHDRAVTEAFHLTYVTDIDAEPGEHELRPEDMEVEALPGDTVDVADIAVEQVLLALPDHPVCHPDCRGLCPVCGTDRNRTPCDCRAQAPDPRFAALARWKSSRAS